MELKEEKVIFIIADISGYTKYMITNKTELAHGQHAITELTNTIINQVEIPLEVSKLEGDAVFLYAVKKDGKQYWEDVKKNLGGKLIIFLEAFSKKIEELNASTSCNCGACSNIRNLKLKIIVHSGEALFYRIGKFDELSGVDVIIVHRLLKNSVKSSQYILMTEPAYYDIDFPQKIEVGKGVETYDEIGTIKTFIYFPPGEEININESPKKFNYFTIFSKMKNTVLKKIGS